MSRLPRRGADRRLGDARLMAKSELVRDYLQNHAELAADPLSPALLAFNTPHFSKVWARVVALRGANAPPPFWAIVWPGSRALAHWLLRNESQIRGARVLELGCGNGLTVIAAAAAGATAGGVDLCPEAVELSQITARLNGVEADFRCADVLVEGPDALADFDLILAADMLYDQKLAAQVMALLRTLDIRKTRVIIAEPGRSYTPTAGVRLLSRLATPTYVDIEGVDSRETLILELTGDSG